MVTLRDIQEQTHDLSSEEREGLLSYLLRGLRGTPEGPSDEEIHERERELDSGEVETISYKEFLAEAKLR